MSSDMSIKMIQSFARCRLDCSLLAYCIKVINRYTSNCLGDKVGKQSLPVCNICNTSFLFRQTFRTASVIKSHNFPQIDLSF